MARAARNYQVAPGVQRFSRGKMYHKRGLFKKLSKPFPKQKKQTQKSDEFVVKKVGGDKNGKERRIPLKKSPKAILGGAPASRTKRNPKIPRLRGSIMPGTILILLTGPHRGKRVIFLKQMSKSGLLLVTGPLKLNATPMRRVAQSFVIATKTRIDVSGVQVPEHINDDYFKKSPKSADKSKGGIFATGEQTGKVVSEQKKKDQKLVDSQVLAAVKKHPDGKYLYGYLGSRFSLAKNQYPHQLVF